MSDSPNSPPSDLQSMINSVAASVEKAIAKLLVQNPRTDTATEPTTEPKESTFPRDLPAIKRQWKGAGSGNQKPKGKALLKGSHQAERRGPLPPCTPSSEDDHHNPAVTRNYG
ncbi:Hypothetical predicted protein [Pelobates cultripes]|uniref:Uncharacterized protein n=1 Tax=Pelobates cultripes TaxID=61616 RepID=A0AAD1S5N0_PELCU|nr:Hypothetical predicted protein [Pelobates cultripes]